MGKVKAFFMEMEDDAKTMKEKDFVDKYGEEYQYIWRNEQIWIESQNTKKEKSQDPEQGHEMWEGGG
jgi:hypothetical protein